MATEYRVTGVAKQGVTLGGIAFSAGDRVTYDLGETEGRVAVDIARSLSLYLGSLSLQRRTITEWAEAVRPEPDADPEQPVGG